MRRDAEKSEFLDDFGVESVICISSRLENFKLKQNLNLILFCKIPRNLSFSMNFEWKLSWAFLLDSLLFNSCIRCHATNSWLMSYRDTYMSIHDSYMYVMHIFLTHVFKVDASMPSDTFMTHVSSEHIHINSWLMHVCHAYLHDSCLQDSCLLDSCIDAKQHFHDSRRYVTRLAHPGGGGGGGV